MAVLYIGMHRDVGYHDASGKTESTQIGEGNYRPSDNDKKANYDDDNNNNDDSVDNMANQPSKWSNGDVGQGILFERSTMPG